MAVTKCKPTNLPRTLEIESAREFDEQGKKVQNARRAMSRSRQLIEQSRKMVASSLKLCDRYRA